MTFTFSSANNIFGNNIIKTAFADKRKLYYSVRVSITVIIVAVTYWRVRVQLGGFSNSLICAAATVLPSTELHVGETLSKATINIVANILGVLLGYGLRMFNDHAIGEAKFAFLLPIVFILIVLGKSKYDYGTTTFLQAMIVAALGPDWLIMEFFKNAATLGIAYTLTILSSLLPPFWVGVDIHTSVQEYLDTLATIFQGLDEECFGKNFMYENLQDEPFRQSLQSLIDSKEKENSLSEFVSWELPWCHLQKQYEKIGDLSRRCASTIQSLSTYLTTKYSSEKLHFSPELREICREICSESAKALAQLSFSMKHKTAPSPSISIHLSTALVLASHLEINTLEAKDMTSRLVESVKIIKQLVSSIEELTCLLPFNSEPQKGDDKLGHIAIGVGPTAGPV